LEEGELPSNGDRTRPELLSDSEGYRSLFAERKVFEDVRALGWDCVHGSLYLDRESGKLRELDLIARQVWRRGKKPIGDTLTLHLPVEVKTAVEWSIIFPAEPAPVHIPVQNVWIGDEFVHKRRALHDLQRSGLTHEQLKLVADKWSATVFDRSGFGGSEFPQQPPAVEHIATTFQEVRPKSDRERETSVLWKAIRSLFSAVEALTDDLTDQLHRRITDDVVVFLDLGEDPMPEAIRGIYVATRSTHLVHPIVVTGSQLYRLANGVPTRVNHFRFIEVAASGGILRWCDVLSASASPEYLKSLTHFYVRGFRQKRGRRVSDGAYDRLQRPALARGR
jgi:hypothetical protein